MRAHDYEPAQAREARFQPKLIIQIENYSLPKNLTKIRFSDGRTRITTPISYKYWKLFEKNGISCDTFILDEDDMKYEELPKNSKLIIYFEDYKRVNKMKTIPSNVIKISDFSFFRVQKKHGRGRKQRPLSML